MSNFLEKLRRPAAQRLHPSQLSDLDSLSQAHGPDDVAVGILGHSQEVLDAFGPELLAFAAVGGRGQCEVKDLVGLLAGRPGRVGSVE